MSVDAASSFEFKLDLSQKAGGSSKSCQPPTKFDHLCDNIESCFNTHLNCLDELYNFKDELLKHYLPTNLLLKLTLLSSRIFRSCTDLDAVVYELVRLVRQYSVPWEEKSLALRKIKADYESKQRQLSIALRQLESLAIKAEQMEHEKRLNNWMRLYSRVMSVKSIGRRWKFRIEPFKKKLSEGFNPYISEESSDESDSEDDSQQHRSSFTASDEELKELTSELSHIIPTSNSRLDSKRVQFGHDDRPYISPIQSSPIQVETQDAISWTNEPNYKHHLLVILYRPKGLLKDKDIVCTITLEDQFFTSAVYKPPTNGATDEEDYQTFYLTLTDAAAVSLNQKSYDIFLTPKLNVAVFPRSIADNVAAYCSIPLPDISLKGEPIVLIPPNANYDISDEFNGDEGKGDLKAWQPDWDSVLLDLLSSEPEAVSYPLKLSKQEKEDEDTSDIDDDDDNKQHLLMICQWIKIQQHCTYHSATSTVSWDRLMEEMGYKLISDTQSRAVSAANLVRSPTPDMTTEVDRMTMEDVTELTLKHAEDLKLLQKQYEEKLETLSKTLSKVKHEKQKEIDALEQALIESESSKRGRKFKSSNEMRQLIAQKRRFVEARRGLPQWGKDWPDDFFERMELFVSENLRKHAKLTERIKHEIKETYERQLLALNRLAQTTTNVDSSLKDVCLPAVYMPTNTTHPLVYNPRAHNYFHPPGSKNVRVSQPPAIFKLPPVQQHVTSNRHLSTVNLYELSSYKELGCHWLHTAYSSHHASPRLTPAPPPSACDYYTQ